MRAHFWLSLVGVMLYTGTCLGEKPPGDKRLAALLPLQGKWLCVEERQRVPIDPKGKLIVKRHAQPTMQLEISGNLGVFQRISEEGAQGKTAPFALVVEPNTKPLSGYYVSYPIHEKRGHNILAFVYIKVEEDTLYIGDPLNNQPPTTFDPATDPNCHAVAVFRRVKN